jgi:hypothetical protein
VHILAAVARSHLSPKHCAAAAATAVMQHAFGAYYGLAASLVLSNGRQAFGAYTSANIKNSASYTSNLFSMIGTACAADLQHSKIPMLKYSPC